MCKVFIVSWNGIFASGGVERVMYYINMILKDRGYQVEIVDKSAITSEFKTDCENCSTLKSAYLSCKYIKQKRKKGEIVIANGYNAPFVKKDILFCHGSMYGFCKAVFNNVNWELCLLEFISAHTSRNIWAVSQKAKKEWEKYYFASKNKFEIVNNMVEDRVFYPYLKENKEQLIHILYCGRLEEAKGLNKLKELAEYIECQERYVLYIAMAGEENAGLFERYEKTKIKSNLTIEELNEFYNCGDVFFFPSKYEGFPLVVLESLAAGVPVVGFDAGNIKELEKSGFPGIMCIEEADIEKIVAVLDKQAMEYQSFEKRNMLHENVRVKFGMESYKKMILEYFEQILKHR